MSKQSSSEKRLRFFGKWIASPTFSIGSAVATTVAMAGMSFLSGLTLPWMILLLTLVFLAETSTYIYFYKDSVPNILTSCFIKNIFEGLSPLKKVLLGMGIFASIGAGLAFGGLTVVSSTAAVTTILGLFSLSCPPVAIIVASILGLSAVLCLGCLLLSFIENAIRYDIHLQVLQFFKNNFTRDVNKSLMQQGLEVFFKLLFVTTIVVLTIIGTIATLGTIKGGLASFLSLIPNANALAVNISSSIISYALMGAARLPWILTSACLFMSSFGETIGKKLYELGYTISSKLGLNPPLVVTEEPVKEKWSWSIMGASFLKISSALIHGFSFGTLAKSGEMVLNDVMKAMSFPLEPATMLQVAGNASLISQGTVQAAISTHSFFGKKPDDREPSDDSELSNSGTVQPP